MSLNKGKSVCLRGLWGLILGVSLANVSSAVAIDIPVVDVNGIDAAGVNAILNNGVTELTENVIDPEIIGEAVRAADPSTAGKLMQAISTLKYSVAMNVLANAYAIYELDSGNYARTYAEKNYETAKATGLITRSMVSLGYAITAYTFELSEVVPALLPLAIFSSIAVSIEYGLSKRYEKMDQTEKTHLFFHQLYHKYFVEYERHSPFAQLNNLTGIPTLVMVKDADLLAQTIDLRQSQVQIQQVGTLHLPHMDQRDQLMTGLVNVREHWLKHGKNTGKEDVKDRPYRHIYQQQHVPEAGATKPSVQKSIASEDVMALLLPAQPKYTVPWERRVITTKKGGVYAKNFQLGASLALSLEKNLYSVFKPYFFMQENRHLTQLLHEQPQVHQQTVVRVVLPPRALELMLLVEPWMVPTLHTMVYRLQADQAADQYYSFNSDFFQRRALQGQSKQTENPLLAKKVQVQLEGGLRDTFWVMHLQGLDFDGSAVVRQEEGQVVIEANDQKLIVNIKNTTGHLLIHGVTETGGSTRYVRLNAGSIKSNVLSAETLARYVTLKEAYVDEIERRMADKQADDDNGTENTTDNTASQTKIPPTSLFLSNATWEVGTAKLQFNDGSITEISLPAEDTTEVTLHRDIHTLEAIIFSTTKSVRNRGNPSRTIDKSMLLDYLVEGGAMLCYRLDQGQKAADFKVTPNLCAANVPSYQIGTAPIEPTLRDDKKILYQLPHLRSDAPDERVRYHKLLLDNQTRETVYVSLRYRYAGEVYRLVVDDPLTPWQKVRYLGHSLGSRAEYHLPEGAEILSLRAVYDTKSGLYDFFEIDADNSALYQATHDDEIPVIGVMDRSRYFDLTKGLLHSGRLMEVTPGIQQQRYRDSYKQDRLHYESIMYMGQHRY
ncbi:MAG: hypothetical protein ISP86_03785 [Shewanellaceae bacterium]|nr:hypothetical protein [Shewanellaceae bacterium]